MQWSEYSFILKPSSIGGIGVFATHFLTRETPIFCGSFEYKFAKIKDIPAEFLPYCIYINSDDLMCPVRFDRMEIGWYINHSFTPNIVKKSTGVYTLRNIEPGEEVLMDYNSLNEPENLKENYYKKLK